MKLIVLLGDGMSDRPLESLGGKTPLQAATTPHMDFMARRGTLGLARTVPFGLPPGSDVANLSVFGYDPRSCYTGRSPLEAASMGVELGPHDVAYRINLVTLVPQSGTIVMKDYSSGHIDSDDARKLVESLQNELGSPEFEFYPGVGYRHLMVWRGGRDDVVSTPPHDITGQSILPHLPRGGGAERLIELMNSSQMLFKGHPVNRRREKEGKAPATSIWLWGQGKAPRMESFRTLHGLSGAVISAVDLIRGIGVYAGLEVIRVPGATGYVDTNYEGKAKAALDALKRHDFVYLHVEAPDEASHAGSLENKIRAIEDFDARIVGPILRGGAKFDDLRILCMPDHPTPLSLMTHTSDPVPFVLYRGENEEIPGVEGYDEKSASATGVVVEEGFRLLPMMTER